MTETETETETTQAEACERCAQPIDGDAPRGLCPRCLMTTAQAAPTPESFVPPTLEELDRLLPQFDVRGLLGRGGMGAVYEARDTKLDRKVAIKVLPPALADDLGFVERFTREARAMARLNHPHVVTIHDFGEVEGCCYLVLELVEGENLRARVGALPPGEAAALLLQIAEGLAYAHAEGIVHRDVKPENILLGRDGRVRLADFGLAKAAAEGAWHSLLPSLTGTLQALGTPHYAAPEQLGGGEVDARADVYAFGVVAYELLTGSLPLGRFPDPSATEGVDPGWDDLLLAALDRDPTARPADGAALVEAIQAIAAGSAPAAPRAPKPRTPSASGEGAPKPTREPDRYEGTFGVAAMVLGLIVFLSGFLPWARVEVDLGRVLAKQAGGGFAGMGAWASGFAHPQVLTLTAFQGTAHLGPLVIPCWLIPVLGLALAGVGLAVRTGKLEAPWRALLVATGAGLLLACVFGFNVLNAPKGSVQLGLLTSGVCLLVLLVGSLRGHFGELHGVYAAPAGHTLTSSATVYRARNKHRRRKALRDRLAARADTHTDDDAADAASDDEGAPAGPRPQRALAGQERARAAWSSDDAARKMSAAGTLAGAVTVVALGAVAALFGTKAAAVGLVAILLLLILVNVARRSG